MPDYGAWPVSQTEGEKTMTERRFKRKSAGDLVRVGAITSPGGHTPGIWGEKMNPTGDFIRTTGMLMTHAWSIRPDFARGLQEKFQGTQVVDDPRDMIGHIDGVIIDDVTALSLYPLFARPFLEAGIPTLVASTQSSRSRLISLPTIRSDRP